VTGDEEFTEVLATLLRDVRAQCPVQPDVREEDGEYPGVMLYAPDGTGQCVYWGPDDRPGVRLAEVADQVQEWAVESLWMEGEPAVWPHCPKHPNSHPLAATVIERTAVWVCPKGGPPIHTIGELPPRRANT